MKYEIKCYDRSMGRAGNDWYLKVKGSGYFLKRQDIKCRSLKDAKERLAKIQGTTIKVK